MIKWDEKYSGTEWFYGFEPNDFLVDCQAYVEKCDQVLCLGAGEGRNAIYLLRLGKFVDAVDLSVVGLNKLKSRARQLEYDDFRIFPIDVQSFQFQESHYDLITAIWFHGPYDMKSYVFEKVKQSLKPGGLFLLEAYTPKQLDYKTGGPPTSELMYSKELLDQNFAEFDILISKEVEREIQEGKGHHGQSATVQFLARKKI